MNLASITATQALARFREGSLSPVELIDSCLTRIEHYQALNAFSCINAAQARHQAEAAAKRWQAGTPCGPVDGIPITIKDLTPTKGLPTRMGSTSTDADGPWDIDAPVSAHLKAAGAIVIGKTTSPEFGWKGVTDNPLHGITRNPWNPALTPGGSSGGAGVAAALNLGLLHQGSDAGGSIRIPASFTGTFGIKPTFGWVPQWPASAMSTLSHLGPMTRSVADSALMLRVMAQPDARDGYAGNPQGPDWQTPPPADLRGWRIAFSANLGYVDVAPDIARCVAKAVAQLEALGATVEHIDPGFDDPLTTFNTLWFSGATQVLERLSDAQLAHIDPGFVDIAQRGQALALSDYLAARRQRSELTAAMAAFHQRYDLLITPMMPIAPFTAGHNVPPEGPYHDWMDWTPFSYPFNLTQQPAASLPCGLDDQGLPVGLQLVAGKYQDMKVLHAAQLLERVLPRLAPPVL